MRRSFISTVSATHSPRPENSELMGAAKRYARHLAKLVLAISVIWLLTASIGTKDANAFWGGTKVDPSCPATSGLSGACPTAHEACWSWAMFYTTLQ